MRITGSPNWPMASKANASTILSDLPPLVMTPVAAGAAVSMAVATMATSGRKASSARWSVMARMLALASPPEPAP